MPAFFHRQGQSAQDWQYEQHLFRHPWRNETEPGMQALHGYGPTGQNGRPGPYMTPEGNVRIPVTAHGDEGFELLNFDPEDPQERAGFAAIVLIGFPLWAAGMLLLPESLIGPNDINVGPAGPLFWPWMVFCAWFTLWAREGVYEWERAKRTANELQRYLHGVTARGPAMAQAVDGYWHGGGVYDDEGRYYGPLPRRVRPWRSRSGKRFDAPGARGGVYTNDGYSAMHWKDYQRPNMLWPPGWLRCIREWRNYRL